MGHWGHWKVPRFHTGAVTSVTLLLPVTALHLVPQVCPVDDASWWCLLLYRDHARVSVPRGSLPSRLQPPSDIFILSSGWLLPFLFTTAALFYVASPAAVQVHRVQMEFCDYWPPLAGNRALSVVQENLPKIQSHTLQMQTPRSQQFLGFMY